MMLCEHGSTFSLLVVGGNGFWLSRNVIWNSRTLPTLWYSIQVCSFLDDNRWNTKWQNQSKESAHAPAARAGSECRRSFRTRCRQGHRLALRLKHAQSTEHWWKGSHPQQNQLFQKHRATYGHSHFSTQDPSELSFFEIEQYMHVYAIESPMPKKKTQSNHSQLMSIGHWDF